VRKKSILLKGVLCGLIYVILHLLIIPTQYILNLSLLSALALGILCGVAIAIVSYCDTVKRTIIAMIVGISSAAAMFFALSISGIPYAMIMYIFRNDEAIKAIGHLTVNEVIEYNFGLLFFFWPGLLISFIILMIIILIFIAVRNRTV